MKKNLLFIFFSLLLVACAGEPPKWWNPSNAYVPTVKQETPAKSNTTTSRKTTVVKPTVLEPTEENIILQDDSFEEMTLAPLPQDLQEESDDTTVPTETVNNSTNLPTPSVLED